MPLLKRDRRTKARERNGKKRKERADGHITPTATNADRKSATSAATTKHDSTANNGNDVAATTAVSADVFKCLQR